jgi:hypothetical protein
LPGDVEVVGGDDGERRGRGDGTVETLDGIGDRKVVRREFDEDVACSPHVVGGQAVVGLEHEQPSPPEEFGGPQHLHCGRGVGPARREVLVERGRQGVEVVDAAVLFGDQVVEVVDAAGLFGDEVVDVVEATRRVVEGGSESALGPCEFAEAALGGVPRER